MTEEKNSFKMALQVMAPTLKHVMRPVGTGGRCEQTSRQSFRWCEARLSMKRCVYQCSDAFINEEMRLSM